MLPDRYRRFLMDISQGAVKKVRQVTVRFSAPMVPFGDPRLSEPFAIDCPAKGTARWADSRNWVYDFDQDLPAGLRCEFRLKDGVKTLDGAAIGGDSDFAVSTGGPAYASRGPSKARFGDRRTGEVTAQALELHALMGADRDSGVQ